jgi:Na+-driven multidrug efflux pump
MAGKSFVKGLFFRGVPVIALPVAAEEERRHLTEGAILKGLLAIAVPMILGNLLQSAFELADLYFVGKLGSDAIAGVALSTLLVLVLATFIQGLVTATIAFVSRHYGAGEHRNVEIVFQHSLYLGLAVSLALAALGWLFAKDLFLLLGASDAVAVESVAYLTVFLTGLFVMIDLWVILVTF